MVLDSRLVFFFFKQKAAYDIYYGLVGSEMCIRDRLLCLPLVDVLLLAFTAMDLRRGSTATFSHGLAAAYVGFTLAFGGMAVKWADAHLSLIHI
mgnify:CR=1 FL=1